MSSENKIEVDTAIIDDKMFVQENDIDKYIKWKTKHNFVENKSFLNPQRLPLVMSPICDNDVAINPGIVYHYDNYYFDKKVIDFMCGNNRRNIAYKILYNYATYNAITLGQLCQYVGASSFVFGDEGYKKDFTGLRILINTNVFDTAFLNEPLEETVFSHQLLIEDYVENKCKACNGHPLTLSFICEENYRQHYIKQLGNELFKVINYSYYNSPIFTNINPSFKNLESFKESFQKAINLIKTSSLVKTSSYFSVFNSLNRPGNDAFIKFILLHQYPAMSFNRHINDFKESYKVMVL